MCMLPVGILAYYSKAILTSLPMTQRDTLPMFVIETDDLSLHSTKVPVCCELTVATAVARWQLTYSCSQTSDTLKWEWTTIINNVRNWIMNKWARAADGWTEPPSCSTSVSICMGASHRDPITSTGYQFSIHCSWSGLQHSWNCSNKKIVVSSRAYMHSNSYGYCIRC